MNTFDREWCKPRKENCGVTWVGVKLFEGFWLGKKNDVKINKDILRGRWRQEPDSEPETVSEYDEASSSSSEWLEALLVKHINGWVGEGINFEAGNLKIFGKNWQLLTSSKKFWQILTTPMFPPQF